MRSKTKNYTSHRSHERKELILFEIQFKIFN